MTVPISDIQRIYDRLDAIENKRDVDMQQITSQLSRLVALQESEGDRCPYREDIARGRNNVKRMEGVEQCLDKLNDKLTNLQIRVATISAGAGIAGGVATGVVIEIFKRYIVGP